LTRLQGRYVLACGTLKIHREPHWPDNESHDARANVLRDLQTLFIRKFLDPNIVGLNFCLQLDAAGCLILGL